MNEQYGSFTLFGVFEARQLSFAKVVMVQHWMWHQMIPGDEAKEDDVKNIECPSSDVSIILSDN